MKINMKKIKVKEYKDGVSVRIPNRRITVVIRENDPEKRFQILLQAIVPPKELGFNDCLVFRGKYKQTAFSLTRESAMSLYVSLGNMLLRTEPPKEQGR
jgi:hypothetical protein